MSLSQRIPVLVVGLSLSGVLGILYAWSIFVLPLEQTFGWNRDQTSLTFTLAMVFFGLGMFLGGKGLDNPALGPRLTCSIGGLLVSGGFFMASFSDSLAWLYISYGILGGFGLGIANSVPMTVCLRWFPDQKGKVSGALAMALAFGTFFFGVQGGAYLIPLVGWATTFRLIALILFVVSFAGVITLRFPTTIPNQNHAHAQNLWGYSLRQALGSLSFWLLLSWAFCLQFGGLMIIGHLVPMVVEQGISELQASIAIGVFSICNGLGRLAFGALWDRYGRRMSMTLNPLVMALGLLSFAFLPALFGVWGVWISAALAGLGFGGVIPHLAATTSAFFGPSCFGTIYGFAALSFIISALTGPVVGSHIRTISGDYTVALFIAVAFMIPCIFLALALRPPPSSPLLENEESR